MAKSLEEFKAYRTEMNEKILNSGFNDYKKFFALDNKAYIDGALPAKMKELMGLVASMVLRCNDCILYINSGWPAFDKCFQMQSKLNWIKMKLIQMMMLHQLKLCRVIFVFSFLPHKFKSNSFHSQKSER